MIIDTHIHLYAEEFNNDRDVLITNAIRQDIGFLLMPNIDIESIAPMHDLEAKYSGHCMAMMGLHPCYVKENYKQQLDIVESWLNQRHYIAIGEIGIDLYWEKAFAKQQEEAFLIQCRWAVAKKIPIVIHSRESFEEIYQLLEGMGGQHPRGVFHCFTGTVEQAQRAIALGFKLGIGGVVTFKNGGLDQVINAIPMEHFVLETDAPYLAPVPHRGKRNEPGFIREIAKRVAAVKSLTVSEVCSITTANAKALFNLT